jgi:hypothetical protein
MKNYIVFLGANLLKSKPIINLTKQQKVEENCTYKGGELN